MTLFTSSPLFTIVLAAALLVTGTVYTVRRRKSPLKDIRGPDATSFWLGNMGDMRYQKEVGDVEFPWMREYGSAWKLNGCMGEEHLMVVDPKALQYILQTSAYRFPKPRDWLANIRMIGGEGIVWVHGEQHQRHRKIMNPAFFAPQLRTFLSLFQRQAEKLSQKWKDEVLPTDTSSEPVVNIHKWLSRTTMDVIGEAGFDFEFGALDNIENPLNKVYDNLFVDSTLYPHRFDIVFRSLWRHIPNPILNYLRYLPGREYTRFRHYLDFIREFSRGLMAKSDAKGDGSDIMSILKRANAAESRFKLSESEVIDQISTLLLAGHDTTASSLTWWLWELAKHPESQSRIRDEIAGVRAKVGARGDAEFSVADLDGMTFMLATLKEAMRLHPIVWFLIREAGQDDILPLAFPITTKSGAKVSSIPVKKGQIVHVSIATYNRLPGVWGDDAEEWNPERFLNIDKARQTSLGVYANLMNFSAGIRACIGWRFSVIEMQAIASALIENFEFGLPPQTEKTKIHRKPSTVMAPMVDGYPGIWMGLKIKSLK
ncbi:cytochrome P450 [Mycena vulgaris]|nr:cytochrome P450 [Mycena vulgaris]